MFSTLINSFLPRPRAATVQSYGHPRAGIIGWMNPEDNVSGETVTETTAMKYAALWCGVRIISEILASLPCILYRRNGPQNKERASDDPRYWLVHDYPCEELDAYHFFEVSTAHQVLWGNSYARIIRDGFNAPLEMDLRLPDRMDVKRRRDDGVLVYECNDPKEVVEFPDMLHGVGFSHDGIKGYSLIEKAAQSLGIAVAAEKHAGSSLRSGNIPSGILDLPVKTDKPAREHLRKEWDEIHDGANKAGRLAIIHGGMKYTPISMNHENAQLLESRKFAITEIARWLRLPPHMLGDLENSQVRANIEQQAMDFLQYGLAPWTKRWQGALQMKLLRRDERRTLYFEFLLDSLLRGDTYTRYQAHAIARQWGFKSVNEIRSMENDNDIGPDGDEYVRPMNMVPLGEENDVPDTIRKEYQSTLKETLVETIEVAKQMKGTLERGFCSVQEAFAECGHALHQNLSSQRETFGLIKKDIEQVQDGVSVSVSVPDVAGLVENVVCQTYGGEESQVVSVVQSAYESDARIRAAVKGILTENLRVVFRIESAEAVKAARGYVRDKTQNFVDRIDKFFVDHAGKVQEAIAGPVSIAGADIAAALVEDHITVSKREIFDSADGSPEGFEQRVKTCVDSWLTGRLEKEVDEYHARMFG